MNVNQGGPFYGVPSPISRTSSASELERKWNDFTFERDPSKTFDKALKLLEEHQLSPEQISILYFRAKSGYATFQITGGYSQVQVTLLNTLTQRLIEETDIEKVKNIEFNRRGIDSFTTRYDPELLKLRHLNGLTPKEMEHQFLEYFRTQELGKPASDADLYKLVTFRFQNGNTILHSWADCFKDWNNDIKYNKAFEMLLDQIRFNPGFSSLTYAQNKLTAENGNYSGTYLEHRDNAYYDMCESFFSGPHSDTEIEKFIEKFSFYRFSSNKNANAQFSKKIYTAGDGLLHIVVKLLIDCPDPGKLLNYWENLQKISKTIESKKNQPEIKELTRPNVERQTYFDVLENYIFVTLPLELKTIMPNSNKITPLLQKIAILKDIPSSKPRHTLNIRLSEGNTLRDWIHRYFAKNIPPNLNNPLRSGPLKLDIFSKKFIDQAKQTVIHLSSRENSVVPITSQTAPARQSEPPKQSFPIIPNGFDSFPLKDKQMYIFISLISRLYQEVLDNKQIEDAFKIAVDAVVVEDFEYPRLEIYKVVRNEKFFTVLQRHVNSQKDNKILKQNFENLIRHLKDQNTPIQTDTAPPLNENEVTTPLYRNDIGTPGRDNAATPMYRSLDSTPRRDDDATPVYLSLNSTDTTPVYRGLDPMEDNEKEVETDVETDVEIPNRPSKRKRATFSNRGAEQEGIIAPVPFPERPEYADGTKVENTYKDKLDQLILYAVYESVEKAKNFIKAHKGTKIDVPYFVSRYEEQTWKKYLEYSEGLQQDSMALGVREIKERGKNKLPRRNPPPSEYTNKEKLKKLLYTALYECFENEPYEKFGATDRVKPSAHSSTLGSGLIKKRRIVDSREKVSEANDFVGRQEKAAEEMERARFKKLQREEQIAKQKAEVETHKAKYKEEFEGSPMKSTLKKIKSYKQKTDVPADRIALSELFNEVKEAYKKTKLNEFKVQEQIEKFKKLKYTLVDLKRIKEHDNKKNRNFTEALDRLIVEKQEKTDVIQLSRGEFAVPKRPNVLGQKRKQLNVPRLTNVEKQSVAETDPKSKD